MPKRTMEETSPKMEETSPNKLDGSKGPINGLRRSPKVTDLTNMEAIAAAFAKMSLDSGAEPAARHSAPTVP